LASILISELAQNIVRLVEKKVSVQFFGDWEWEMGRWGDGEMGRWGDGETGRL
jgi:hypothetical protein